MGEIYTQCSLRMFTTFFGSSNRLKPRRLHGFFTLYSSKDAVLRKYDLFDSYKSEFSYLTEFFGKFAKKLPLFQWENFETAITPVVYKTES